MYLSMLKWKTVGFEPLHAREHPSADQTSGEGAQSFTRWKEWCQEKLAKTGG